MTSTAVAATQSQEAGSSLGRDAWRRVRRDPVAITGFVLILFFLLVAIFAPLLAPYGPNDFPGQGQHPRPVVAVLVRTGQPGP